MMFFQKSTNLKLNLSWQNMYVAKYICDEKVNWGISESTDK